MTDARLEQLRREWDTGDAQVRAQCLREGLRAGVIPRRLIRALATLGVDYAASALEMEPRQLDLEEALVELSGDLVAGDVQAAVHSVLSVVLSSSRVPLSPAAVEACELLLVALTEPTPRLLIQVADAIRGLRSMRRPRDPPQPILCLLEICFSTVRHVTGTAESQFVTGGSPRPASVQWLVEAALELVGPNGLKEALQRALSDRALGRSPTPTALGPELELTLSARLRPAMYVGDTHRRGVANLVENLVRLSVADAMGGSCASIHVGVARGGEVTLRDDSPDAVLGFRATLLAQWSEAGVLSLAGMAYVVPSLCTTLVAEALGESGGVKLVFDNGILLEDTTLPPGGKPGRSIRFTPHPRVFRAVALEEAWGIVAEYLRIQSCHLSLDCTLGVAAGQLRFSPRPLEQLLRPWRGDIAVNQARAGESVLEPAVELERPVFRVSQSYNDRSDGLIQVQVSLVSGGWLLPRRSFACGLETREGGAHAEALEDAIRTSLLPWGNPTNVAAVISVWLDQPRYEGATRTRLGNVELRQPLEELITPALTAWFAEHPEEAEACCGPPWGGQVPEPGFDPSLPEP